jgi:hypothetical protein
MFVESVTVSIHSGSSLSDMLIELRDKKPPRFKAELILDPDR